MNYINADTAPAAIGPYSHATVVNNLIYTSGQIPVSPETNEVVGDNVTEQTYQALKNLIVVLEAAGSSLDNVVKTTCFLTDMANFADFNLVYAEHFNNKPARSCVAVRELPKNVLVEVEAIAEICN